MLVGVLSGPSLKEYHNICLGAPIQLIEPPIIWLSSPEERLSGALKQALTKSDAEENHGVKIQMRAVMFRDLLNFTTNLPGMYAACLVADGTPAFELRSKLGVKDPDPDFIPNFLVVHDAMRSLKCRKFFRSFCGALSKRIFTWVLFEAHNYIPEHKTLFENYNEAVKSELINYSMFSEQAQRDSSQYMAFD
jgi:hypothetical protein